MTSPGPSADGQRPRCADVAEAAGDPLEGTAPPAQQWFLVEHPGPWDRYVLADRRFDRAAAVALDGWSRAETGRVLFVRRPQRATRVPERGRWFRVDSRPGREAVRTGLFTHEGELVDVVADPGAGEPDDGPLFLVCAHGRHDTCCAVRGRPLAAAVAAAAPESAWECSHLGGCRFAPALVLLPHGFVLGGVPPADVERVLADHAAGLVVPELVRGRSTIPPAAQAAQHHARLATGSRGVDDLRVLSVTAPAPGQWRVELADPDVVVDLTEQSVAAGRHLTCSGPDLGRMRTFTLQGSVRPLLPTQQ